MVSGSAVAQVPDMFFGVDWLKFEDSVKDFMSVVRRLRKIQSKTRQEDIQLARSLLRRIDYTLAGTAEKK